MQEHAEREGPVGGFCDAYKSLGSIYNDSLHMTIFNLRPDHRTCTSGHLWLFPEPDASFPDFLRTKKGLRHHPVLGEN